MGYTEYERSIEKKKAKAAGIALCFILPAVAWLIYFSLNNTPKNKFSSLPELVHDAATISYRGHEYVSFMINGQILSPVHDAACKECNKLGITLEE